jgi:hypothetical protein
VGVGVFYAKAKVGGRSSAIAVCPESFLFRAEDLPSLCVVHDKGIDTCGPKLIKSIDQYDGAVVIQPRRVPFFFKENGVAFESRWGRDPYNRHRLEQEV